MFFHHYGIISGSFSVEILAAMLWNLDSTCPLEKFDEKGVSLKKNITISGHESKILSVLFRNFSNAVVKTALYVFISSMKINYSKKVFCSDQFRTRGEIFLAFWHFLFNWVVKTACYVSVARFWGEKKWKNFDFCTIFGLWMELFRPFVEIFPPGLSKMHSKCTWEHFQGEQFFYEIIFFNLFGHWTKKFRPSSKLFLTGLCLHFTLCVQKNILRKILFTK